MVSDAFDECRCYVMFCSIVCIVASRRVIDVLSMDVEAIEDCDPQRNLCQHCTSSRVKLR